MAIPYGRSLAVVDRRGTVTSAFLDTPLPLAVIRLYVKK
jgi:hypothetical protein